MTEKHIKKFKDFKLIESRKSDSICYDCDQKGDVFRFDNDGTIDPPGDSGKLKIELILKKD